MIQEARKRHRWLLLLWTVPLWLLLEFGPDLVVQGIRQVNWEGPAETIELSPEQEARILWMTDEDPVDWSGELVFGDAVANAQLRSVDRGQRVLRLQLQESARRPDLLLYWSEDPADSSLPTDAWLLGSVADTQEGHYRLPREARDGHLTLYSLGHQEIVGSATMPSGGED